MLWLVVKLQAKVLAKKRFHQLEKKKRVAVLTTIQNRKTTNLAKVIAVILSADALQPVQLLQ